MIEWKRKRKRKRVASLAFPLHNLMQHFPFYESNVFNVFNVFNVIDIEYKKVLFLYSGLFLIDVNA
jgi:hypothetical protein